ncbi:hypothetical protein COLO4_37824 [Corchorus olitorius]|uniref:HAT C-terminal dimerisation domain-containing protein n=1 Tax=Corchorus olitorius TaxID=93759 RepID=A0A1R3FZ06_9ROSI|nr:hypothetical protein COLO4_37824 [Corchorus olitorius]
MSESEVINWLRAKDLNPEIDPEADEGENIDLAGGLGETGDQSQRGSGSGNETTREVVDHMLIDDGEESAMDMFWKHEVESGKAENRSELDIFKQEEREKGAEFDVLGCAFGIGGRVLDVYRSCLSAKIVQALICGQDWLRGSPEFNSIADKEEQS